MRIQLKMLALLAVGCAQALAAPDSTNSAPINRVLVINSSSMPVAAGKAVLTIGTLRRTNGVYSGEYKLTVFPYFFKSKAGRLAINVSDECLARVDQGKVVTITGTATTSGKDGKSLHIDVTAVPADRNHGTLRLWFMAGNRKMIFEPAYHFAETEMASISGHSIETNSANLP